MYRHVKKLIAAKWFIVGVELFEDKYIADLNIIKSSGAGNADACSEMLRVWLEKYPLVTWNEFIKALRAPGVELNATATEIEGMLLSPDNGM